MSDGAIETPYTIASLPKPIDSQYGRTWLAPVYGIRGTNKRKRHEAVVGVDGEGISIYNVCKIRIDIIAPLLKRPTGTKSKTGCIVRAAPPDLLMLRSIFDLRPKYRLRARGTQDILGTERSGSWDKAEIG